MKIKKMKNCSLLYSVILVCNYCLCSQPTDQEKPYEVVSEVFKTQPRQAAEVISEPGQEYNYELVQQIIDYARIYGTDFISEFQWTSAYKFFNDLKRKNGLQPCVDAANILLKSDKAADYGALAVLLKQITEMDRGDKAFYAIVDNAAAEKKFDKLEIIVEKFKTQADKQAYLSYVLQKFLDSDEAELNLELLKTLIRTNIGYQKEVAGVSLEKKVLDRLKISDEHVHNSFVIILHPYNPNDEEFSKAQKGTIAAVTSMFISSILGGIPTVFSTRILKNVKELKEQKVDRASSIIAELALQSIHQGTVFTSADDNDLVVFVPEKDALATNFGFSDKLVKKSLEELLIAMQAYNATNENINIENLFKLFSSNYPKKRRFVIDGHGTPGIIAGLNLNDFQKVLVFLNQQNMNTEFLYILSCYAGGTNRRDLQNLLIDEANRATAAVELSPLERKHLLLSVNKKNLLDELTQMKRDREKEFLVAEKETALKSLNEEIASLEQQIEIDQTILPQARSFAINYPIIIQGILQAVTFGHPEIGKFFDKLSEAITSKSTSQTDKSQDKQMKLLVPALKPFYQNMIINFPIIRFQGKYSHFIPLYAVDDTLMILTYDYVTSEVLRESLLRGTKQVTLSVPSTKRGILLNVADLSGVTLDLQAESCDRLPMFVSTITGDAQHFIYKIRTACKDRLTIINRLFLSPVSSLVYDVSRKEWFIDSILEDNDRTFVSVQGYRACVLYSLFVRGQINPTIYMLKSKGQGPSRETVQQYITLPLRANDIASGKFYFEEIPLNEARKFFVPINKDNFEKSLNEASRGFENVKDIQSKFYKFFRQMFGVEFNSSQSKEVEIIKPE